MQFDKNIFDLLNRDDFTYHKDNENTKKEYVNLHSSWGEWCRTLAQKVNKFANPTIQSWQNSGHLAKDFWARLKFIPFMDSPSCVSIHVFKDCVNVELGYELKNEGVSFTKGEYNELLLESLKKWVSTYNIDSNLFYICGENNKYTLNKYFNNCEKVNYFKNIKDVINIGVSFDVEEVSELDTESEKLIDILKNLSYLYESVQKPNRIYDALKNAQDLIPDEYDGSYELVREVVNVYGNVPYDKLTLDDLDAMFFMCIGTFKHGAEAKKRQLRKSNLPENEKNRILNLIDKIVNKSNNFEYEHSSEGPGNFGMFGEAVGSLRASYKDTDDITGAKNFIKMCIDISKMTNDEEIFNLCEKILKDGIKGMQTGKISKFLHCLKPCTFPIINEKQGEGTTIYDLLGIKLNKPKNAAHYIENARIIKNYRDKYFSFKNYRVMDIIKEEAGEVRYWLGGAMYEKEGDVSQKFINENVFAMDWAKEDIKYALKDENLLKGVFDKCKLTNNVRKMFKLFFELKAGDKIAIKSTFAKGKTSILRIKAIGTVQSDAKDGYLYDEDLGHTIPVKWRRTEQFDLEGIGGHWGALSEVTKQEDINKIFFGQSEIKTQNKPPEELKIYSRQQFLYDAYLTEDKYNTILRRLKKKKNIILQGAPGVGKSYLAKRIAYSILEEKDKDRVCMIQFHQSYSYEDFIMGYRPNKNGGFDIVEGVFYKFCKKAIDSPQDKFFFIIDEINRGNLSKIFGELMLLIEEDKRGEEFAMPTIYSEEKFYIPKNLYIIGLMNTADRSLALIDYALRRRFSFIDIEPAFGENFKKYTDKFKSTNLDKVLDVIKVINDDIEADESLGKGFKIGHSYFCNLSNGDNDELMEIIDCEIIPLLEEYWFDNNDKVKGYYKSLCEALKNE